MRLSYLLKDLCPIDPLTDREVLGLNLDSRFIHKNDLFLALKGQKDDGRQYIHDAISSGAIAVLIEADQPNLPITLQQNIPIIPIYQLQKKSAQIAARFYDYPSEKLRIIGVTGTSGKTSCTHFIAQLLQRLNQACGVIGTLGSGFYPELKETMLTTPDSLTLQALLQQLVQQGAQAVAMEVSSHSIDQERINSIPFEMGIFTNLTQDHLDYHGTMENYAEVKRRFLTESFTKQIIINADDHYGQKWLPEVSKQKSVFAFSTQKPHAIPKNIPLIYSDKAVLTLQGIEAQIHTPWGEGKCHVPLIGQFNLSNLLAVITALNVYGIPFNDIVTQLSQLKTVPGRMQMLGGNGKPLVVVDYAHKPDALQKVLQALHEHNCGKLICVFGCGGDRDKSKRSLMGKIAEQFADKIIVTNDNPRHEKPEEIAAQIAQGFSHPERASFILDRSKAIEKSIQWAEANDCILIAGKGAEHYQQFGDEKIHFDDVEHVRQYLTVVPAK